MLNALSRVAKQEGLAIQAVFESDRAQREVEHGGEFNGVKVFFAPDNEQLVALALKLCKGEGWIEILGCGMVHPKVLAGCGLDPEKYSGFAFGIGLERIVMRRFAVDDMRLFYENDTRFLEQF